jgi:hypothetical protein
MVKYIFYLEPVQNSKLYRLVNDHLLSSKQLLGATEANQYHSHCSMTGFFEMPDSDTIVPHIIDYIHNIIAERVNELRIMVGDICCNLYSDEGMVKVPSVRINILTEGFREIASSIKTNFPQLGLRLKPLNHISLAYFSSFPVLRSTETMLSDGYGEDVSQRICTVITRKAVDKLPSSSGTRDYDANLYFMFATQNLTEKLVDIDTESSSLQAWHIVLYEMLFDAENVDEQHVFKLIYSWKLQ